MTMTSITRKIIARGLTLSLFIAIVASSFYALSKPAPRAEAQIGDALGGAVGAAAGCAPAIAIEQITKVKDEAEAIAKGSAASVTGLVGGPQAVIDAANLSKNAATARKLSTEQLVNCVLDGLAWTAAKVAIQSMTQSTVNWINSGFDGSPAYVTDLGRNLSRLADTVADDFINGLDRVIANDNNGFSIRAPFQDQIAAQLREEFYRTTSSYGFNTRNPYSGPNSAFIGGNFRQGGLDGLLSASRPENNPYGRYMLARSELVQQLDRSESFRLQELIWGSGFGSWRGDCGPNARASSGTPAAGTPGGSVDLSQKDNTVGCDILTPGALIEDQLKITAKSPLAQLEIADSVNEIVGALMGQLVTQVLGGTGLSGVSRPAAGGGTSYLNRATNPNQYAGPITSSANQIAQEVTQLRTSVESYRTSWQRIETAANAAEQACRSRAGGSDAARVRELAAKNVSLATAALSEISAFQTTFTTARSNTNDTTALTSVILDYNVLRSGTVGAIDDQSAAARQDATDTGSAQPGSLYSQMQRLAASCR